MNIPHFGKLSILTYKAGVLNGAMVEVLVVVQVEAHGESVGAGVHDALVGQVYNNDMGASVDHNPQLVEQDHIQSPGETVNKRPLRWHSDFCQLVDTHDFLTCFLMVHNGLNKFT